ncbi:TIGR02679 family protein [Actinomadura harenae]|uniref:TIGR02679 family protein n=1 Tax=Actinomadura harenae TaxID=2483351 RepID=UPI0018F74A58|nr:TIGR02679 family protein [Actinomadura harenae]
MDVDLPRLRRTLGATSLDRLVRRLARRVELGRPLTGPLVLDAPSGDEIKALRSLLGSGRLRTAGTVTVDLDRLSAVLADAGIASGLPAAVEALTGPITPREQVRAADRSAREAVAATLATSRHAETGWYREWAETLGREGVLTRMLRRGGTRTAAMAVAVLDALPAPGLPLPVVAERATGDTKALSGTPLATLILRALAVRAGVPAARGAEAERRVWESAGVLTDDLSSQVLVLGLPAEPGGPLAGWLTEAARLRTPFRVTLHQLVTMPLVPRAAEVYVCENPSVLRAAVAAPAGAPLVCTEGIPSAACHRLLEAVRDAGASVRWRGDFDWTGLRTTAMAIDRYGAVPWRMTSADYAAALAEGESEPLRGASAASPWDPSLERRLHATGRAVMEERLVPLLLDDLAQG